MRGYWLENKYSAIDKKHVTLSQILIIQYFYSQISPYKIIHSK